MTPEQLEALEEQTFQTWLTNIKNNYPLSQLNYFEHNIQVWKQLWRVIEKSDIVLQIVDARFPILHFNTTLYNHVKGDHGKDMILCINKIDLISMERSHRWRKFFESYYKELRVCMISQEQSTEEIRNVLFHAIASCKVKKYGVYTSASPFVWNDTPMHTIDENEVDKDTKVDREKHVTIGITGDPNMGKSTIINRLFAKKVVSQSYTPGHTKHFQTLFLLPTLCFCDCPGLVFPKLHIGREIQVLFGLYPISQLREPYTAIRYLAEYLHNPALDEVYKLVPIDDYADDVTNADEVASYRWSPYRILEAFAKKKHFYVRGGRFDVYRAANYILRDALRGEKVVLSFDPPTAEEYDSVIQREVSNTSFEMNVDKEFSNVIEGDSSDNDDNNSSYSSGSTSEEERNIDGAFQLLQIDDSDSDSN